jgi:hypothetical protein
MRLIQILYNLVLFLRLTPRKGLILLIALLISMSFLIIMGTNPGELATLKTQRIMNVLKYLRSSFETSNNGYTSIIRPWGLNKMCKNNGIEHYFLFMFMTSPEKEKERNVIREIFKEHSQVWKSLIPIRSPDYETGDAVKVLFFVGQQREDLKLRERLIVERETHGDLLVDDFEEDYLHLTLKTVRMLKWVQTHCSEVRYLVKLDDDVYFHMPKLVSFLEELNETESQNLIAGHKYSDMRIDDDPNSKWYTPPSVWQGTLPEFVAGFFYILGADARAKLYNAIWKTPVFHLEDVFLTGMVRNRTKGTNPLHTVDIPLVDTNWVWAKNYQPSCSLHEVVVIHPMPIQNVQCWIRKFSQQDFRCSSLWPIFTYCW